MDFEIYFERICRVSYLGKASLKMAGYNDSFFSFYDLRFLFLMMKLKLNRIVICV